MNRPEDGGLLGTGRPSFEGFSFVMKVGKAGPPLFLAAATGEHFAEAILTGEDNPEGGQFLRFTFSDVLITAYNESVEADALPDVNVSFTYSSLEYEFFPQNPDGGVGSPIRAGWDLQRNQRIQ